MKYFISCEGETERWYFEWLQKEINKDSRTTQKVEFIFRNLTPSSFVKSNNSTFTKGMIEGSIFCRIQDIEDYSDFHINKLHSLFESNKKAKQLFKNYNFMIGYSNFTFEVWIMALHNFRKIDVTKQDGKRKIIDAFINSIYLYDDHMKTVYNANGKEEVVALEDLESSTLFSSGAPNKNKTNLDEKSKFVLFFIRDYFGIKIKR